MDPRKNKAFNQNITHPLVCLHRNHFQPWNVGWPLSFPVALDLCSVSLDSSFVHLFNTLFEQLVVSSRSTIKAFNNLRQKICIGYRPVLFLCLLEALSPHVTPTERIYSFQPERNDWNKCLHGWYFSIDWNLEGLNRPSRSDWKLIYIRWDRVILDGNIRQTQLLSNVPQPFTLS